MRRDDHEPVWVILAGRLKSAGLPFFPLNDPNGGQPFNIRLLQPANQPWPASPPSVTPDEAA